MANPGSFIIPLGNVASNTTLNTASAASRKTLDKKGSAVSIEANSGRVFYKFGDSSVTLGAIASADGFVMSGSKERVQNWTKATHIVFWAESDSVVVVSNEVM
jgi:hypothetical protein